MLSCVLFFNCLICIVGNASKVNFCSFKMKGYSSLKTNHYLTPNLSVARGTQGSDIIPLLEPVCAVSLHRHHFPPRRFLEASPPPSSGVHPNTTGMSSSLSFLTHITDPISAPSLPLLSQELSFGVAPLCSDLENHPQILGLEDVASSPFVSFQVSQTFLDTV